MKKIAQRVMGMDQSLNGTGLVVLPRNSNKPDHVSCITPKDEFAKGLPRLQHIRDVVCCTAYNYGITHVFMEGYGFGARGQAIFQLGGIGEILKLSLAEMGITTVIAPPTVLKKFVTGRGNAKKGEMIDGVKQWGFETKNHNVADAYGLAQLGVAWLNPRSAVHRKLFTQVTFNEPLI